MNPFDLDWGVTTIEFYSAKHKIALEFFEHNLKRPAGRARSIRFVGSRGRWLARVLPPDCRPHVVYDQRNDDSKEQPVSNNLLVEFAQRVEWSSLCGYLSHIHCGAEFFPVPSEEPWEPDALAVSVPYEHVGEEKCLREIIEIIERLQMEYDLAVFDMRSARKIDIDSIRLMQGPPLDVRQLLSGAAMRSGPMSFNLKS